MSTSPPPGWRDAPDGARQVMDGRGGRPLWPMFRYTIATALIMIPLGGIESWSRLKHVVRAFLEWKAGAAGHNKAAENIDDVNVVAWLAFGLSMVAFGKLTEEMRYPKVVVMIGAVIGGAGLVLSSLCTSLVGFVFCYGLLLGAACGVYIVPLFYVAKCFPHTSGVLMGFASACFASGELVQNALTAALLKVDTLPSEGDDVPYEVYKRLPWMLRILALFYVSSLIVGSFCLPDPKEVMLRVQFEASYHILRQRGHSTVRANPTPMGSILPGPGYDGINGRLSGGDVGGVCGRSSPFDVLCGGSCKAMWASRLLLRRWWFWLLPLMTFCTYLSGTLVTQNSDAIRAQVISSTEDDSLDADLWSRVAGVAGRLIWGMISDAAGYHYAMVGVSVTSGAFFLSYAFVRNIGLFHTWTGIIFFAWSGNPAVVPTAIAEMLGPQEFAMYYPIVSLGSCVGVAVAYACSSSFGDTVDTGTMVIMAAMVGLCNMVIFPVRYFRTPVVDDAAVSMKWNSGSQDAVASARHEGSQSSLAPPAGSAKAAMSVSSQSSQNMEFFSSTPQSQLPQGVTDPTAPIQRQFSRPAPDVFSRNTSLTDIRTMSSTRCTSPPVIPHRKYSTLPRGSFED